MKSKRILSLLLIALVLLTQLPAPASAAGSVDLTREATLTINHNYAGLPLDGVEFRIYLVSTMDEYGQLTPTEPFQAYAQELDIRGKNDAAWIALAEKLEREIILGNLGDLQPTDTAVTDSQGKAHFPSGDTPMTMGLYLVLSTSCLKDHYVYTTVPFFALVPTADKAANEWDYSVEINAKPGMTPNKEDYTVIKVWEDECHKSDRPKSITIQLMCDGEPYGDPVTLPHNGAWRYTWEDLETNHHWTVEEVEVKGYKDPEVTIEGNVITIVNTCDKPEEEPDDGLPQTGLLWWPVPMLISAGLLMIIIGLIRRRGT